MAKSKLSPKRLIQRITLFTFCLIILALGFIFLSLAATLIGL